MTQRKPALATRVSPNVNASVRRLTKALGITISEYLRKLILDDLESKQMFKGEFKKAVEQSETNDRTQRPKESIGEQLLKAFAREENDDEPY